MQRSLEIVGEVLGREPVIVNVAVFSTRCESKAVWREADRVDRSEMTVNFRQLFSEYYAVETDFKAARTFIRQGHISCVLSARHQNMELLELLRIVEGAHCDCAARSSTKVVLADFLEGLRMQKFGAAISSGREKHCEVVGHGKLIDLVLVDLAVFKAASRIDIDDLQLSGLGGDVESLVEGTPDSAGELLTRGSLNLFKWFWSVFGLEARSDHLGKVVDPDGCHLLVHVDQEELLVTEG